MKQFKEHTLFKIFTLVLVISLITPTLVKLAHVFENHKHEVCLNTQQTHLHTLDLDCEFYKFNTNNNSTIERTSFQLFFIQHYNKVFKSQYHFISEYQQLSFVLRGPPSLI